VFNIELLDPSNAFSTHAQVKNAMCNISTVCKSTDMATAARTSPQRNAASTPEGKFNGLECCLQKLVKQATIW